MKSIELLCRMSVPGTWKLERHSFSGTASVPLKTKAFQFAMAVKAR